MQTPKFVFSIGLLVITAVAGCSGGSSTPSVPKAARGFSETSHVQGTHGGVMVPFHEKVMVEILLDKKNGSAHVFFNPLHKDRFKDLKFVAKVAEGEVEEYVLKDAGYCWELKDEKMMAQFAKGLAGKIILSAVEKETGEPVMMMRYLDLPMK